VRAIFPPVEEIRLVREFFGQEPGQFVEVGANDPQLRSQTWHLEQAGWRGVLIEPLPDLARKLAQTRRADVYAVACSSPENAGKLMPLLVAGGYSTLNAETVDVRYPAIVSIDVRVRTLDDILSEARARPPLDFVSIDVEGHELEVLEGFDVLRWNPRLILIEDHVLTLTLHRYMQAHGYKWVRRTGVNAWYVPQTNSMRVEGIGRLQFIRKYHLARPIRLLREAKRRLSARVKRGARDR
jgi:FkbM family methyltransferase